MNKIVKVMGVGILSLGLAVGLGQAVKAAPIYGNDDWTKGLVDPGNGYVMGYSYYYHGSNYHWSTVQTGSNGATKYAYATAGKTSLCNGPTVKRVSVDTIYLGANY